MGVADALTWERRRPRRQDLTGSRGCSRLGSLVEACIHRKWCVQIEVRRGRRRSQDYAPAKLSDDPRCLIDVWCHAILGDCGNFLVEVAWVNGGGGCPDLGAPAPSPAGSDGFE